MNVGAVFYGDTEDTAREQFRKWAAKEPSHPVLVSLTPDEERGWIWHAEVELVERDQLELAL